jgi:hypothetical protein
VGSSKLQNPSHKRCLICNGIKECPEDCQLGEEHEGCNCWDVSQGTLTDALNEFAGVRDTEIASHPRQDLYDLHNSLTQEALQIMRQKNDDYSSADDPYRNFREFGQLGILVRLSDKLARLRTFTERGELSVKDESVRDTVLDAINYLVLFEGYRSKSEPPEPHHNED